MLAGIAACVLVVRPRVPTPPRDPDKPVPYEYTGRYRSYSYGNDRTRKWPWVIARMREPTATPQMWKGVEPLTTRSRTRTRPTYEKSALMQKILASRSRLPPMPDQGPSAFGRTLALISSP